MSQSSARSVSSFTPDAEDRFFSQMDDDPDLVMAPEVGSAGPEPSDGAEFRRGRLCLADLRPMMPELDSLSPASDYEPLRAALTKLVDTARRLGGCSADSPQLEARLTVDFDVALAICDLFGKRCAVLALERLRADSRNTS
ncbi:MAG: hypothetical protein KGL39_54835 [Patescibacteria group bacterium]|nr:hypothetical protein [Patescibacteria group bacterium]